VGLLRWMRGDESSGASAAIAGGLGGIAEIFQPSRHKQTEHVEKLKERRIDVANGTGVDLERGLVVLRRPGSVPGAVRAHEGADRVGDELNGDRGQE
jgi:hypothetical protein